MSTQTIGRNIRKYRSEKGLRQEDLAEKTGLSNNYVGMIERGEKTPSLETLIAICNALFISADLILADDLDYVKEKKKNIITKDLKSSFREEADMVYDIAAVVKKYMK